MSSAVSDYSVTPGKVSTLVHYRTNVATEINGNFSLLLSLLVTFLQKVVSQGSEILHAALIFCELKFLHIFEYSFIIFQLSSIYSNIHSS